MSARLSLKELQILDKYFLFFLESSYYSNNEIYIMGWPFLVLEKIHGQRAIKIRIITNFLVEPKLNRWDWSSH